MQIEMQRVYTTEELLALLEWYREAGVTHAVDDVATDWRARAADAPGTGFKYPAWEPRPLADVVERPPADVPPAQSRSAPPWDVDPDERPEPARSAPAQSNPPPMPRSAPRPAPAITPRAFPTATPDAAELAARTQARTAHSLDDLRRLLEQFDGCALKATAKNLCFYRGAARARLMVIGEAPDRDDDASGKPFTGPPGQLLDRMLAAIGYDEATAHITNIVYWRPPGNRPPTPAEAQICRPFLERQIELVAPDVVFLLGGVAAKHMLNAAEGIVRLRGSWRDLTAGARRVKVMASLGPDFLLKTPSKKSQVWQDLLAVKLALGKPA